MKKSLLTTNRHLKDAVVRERTLARNIESSSAVEGILVTRDAASGRFVTTGPKSRRTEPVRKKNSR